MTIALIVILTVLALFLILRDDHDDSYTRREKEPGRPSAPKPSYVKTATPKKTSVPNTYDKTPKAPKLDERFKPETPKPREAPVPPFASGMGTNAAGFTPNPAMPDFHFLDRIEYDGGLPERTMSSFICYLQEYCTDDDLGNLAGYVTVDPATEALEVHAGDDRMLGYLPMKDRAAFFNFNPGWVDCPFAGHMAISITGKYYADIRIVLPANRDFVEESLTGFLGF